MPRGGSFSAANLTANQPQLRRSLPLGLMTDASWTHHPCQGWHYNLPEPTRYPQLCDKGGRGKPDARCQLNRRASLEPFMRGQVAPLALWQMRQRDTTEA